MLIIGVVASRHITVALKKAGLDALERAVLPFPSSRRHPDGRTYREHYVEQLAVATA